LLTEIQRKVNEKSGQSSKQFLRAEMIVSEVYDAISIEYNPKFARIEKLLKGLKSQIVYIESRISSVEADVGDLKQDLLLENLVFLGVKQKPGVDLNSSLLSIK
jgi:hypothetical protein